MAQAPRKTGSLA